MAEMENGCNGKEIPAWLTARDSYVPPKDRDRFIGRTVVSLAAVLSRVIGSRSAFSGGSRVSPEVKIISLLAVVLLVALSRGFFFVSAVAAAETVFLAFLDARIIVRILKAASGAFILSFFLLLPSFFFFDAGSSLLLLCKVGISVLSVSLLSCVTRWDDITRSLKVLFVPDIFILVLDITVRYIALLGEFSLEMFHALALRSVGVNRRKHSSLAGIAGTVFLSSRSMADDMYAAMSCRGFTGEYRHRRGFRPGIWDVLFLLFDASVIALFWIGGR